MTDNRSERLRQRRKQSTEKIERQAEDGTGSSTRPADPSSTPEQDPDPVDEDESDEGQDTPSVKEEQIGTYMYLPESQTKEMRRLYNVLKAEYEFEYDEEFEKNRHFYPLVVQYGLERLDGMDASEIRDRLENVV